MIFHLTYKIQYYTVKKIGKWLQYYKNYKLAPPLPHKTIKKTDSDRSPLLMDSWLGLKKTPNNNIY